MSQIHILDGQSNQGEILDYITAKNIISDNHKKSKVDTLETYDFITFADKRFSEFLEKRNRIIIPDEDETLREFIIFEAARYKDSEGYKSQAYTHASYLELKKATILYPDKGYTGTASQHGGRALNDTGWQIGIVESKGTRTLTIESHTNPFAFLKRIAKEFDLELRFRVEHDGNKITGRYVDLLERIGEWRGREAEFGKDLDGIRRVEKQDIVTALLGLGPEKEDGTRLEVLVEDEDALKRWGWEDRYGNINHWIEPYEIQSERSEMTESEARQYTRTALNKRINTQVTYEGSIVDLENVPGMEIKKIRFGDTIRIKDTKFNPPLYLEARIFEQTRSIKSKAKKDIKLGDFVEFTEEEVNNIWEQLRKDIQKRVTAAEMAEYTYDKLTIDDKDEQIYEDGKTFAEATGIDAKEHADFKANEAETNAKGYADEQDGKLKSDVENYADKQADSALSSAKQYAVAKEVYENEMDKIASDIEDRAPLEYVDGEFKIIKDDIDDFNAEIEKKADGSTVYTISEVDNMINNTVSVTEYETDMDGIVTDIESHGTRIGQNEKAIGLKADESYVDTIENSLNTKIGNVEVTAEGASMTASEVRADLDGLEIGGRNLLRDTSSEGTTISISEYGNTGHIGTLSFEQLGLKHGDVVTISSYISNIPEGLGIRLRFDWVRDDGTYGQDMGNQKVMSPDEGRISHTATIPNNREYTGLRIRFYPVNFEANFKVHVSEEKLEKGNKATDWSPAPEDIDESINQVGGRVETLDASVETLAGEVSLKASQSIVDSLENQVENHEAELNVLPGQIELKADAAVVDGIDDRLGSAEIIIDGLESEIKLKADLVDIEGMLTADDLEVRKDLKFGGELIGPTGTFSGSMSTRDLVVENPNAEQEGVSSLKLQLTIDNQGHGDTPYRVEGYTRFYSQGGGLSIDKEDVNGDIVPLDGLMLNSDVLQVTGQLQIGAGGLSGSDYGITFPSYHSMGVSPTQSDSFTVWGNRSGGSRPFLVRSHSVLSGYRDDFYIGGSTGKIYNTATYEDTTGSSANVRITGTGQFWRVQSTRRNKLLEEPIEVDPYKLLDVIPKTWFDKNNTEKLAQAMDLEYKGLESIKDVEITGAKRIPGLVAEDVEDAGLEIFVEYNNDDEVEGLQYDRLWTLLIPISKDHEVKLEDLEVRLEEYDIILTDHETKIIVLEEKVETLELEVNKLKGVA